jgi:alkylhydroperoxidase/carboxymuconolactone decarboxylase family protein YurZ
MAIAQKPPEAYREFMARFPKLGKAWDLAGEAGSEGPLDAKTARLIKLAIAMGAMREGAVHSSVRKAIAAGATPDEIDQVTALCAGTMGFPSVVALYTWTRDVLGGRARPGTKRRA